MNDRFKEKTMKCPGCRESTLVMSDRQGVEIDYCPGCRGVWLDRGELDKLIERSAAAASARSEATSSVRQPDFVDPGYQQDRHRNTGRRKSWLSDIFD
jgi:Zn-finger nucleic acid-binding protein